VLLGIDVRNGAAAGHRRDAVPEQVPARDEDAWVPGPPMNLWGLMNTASLCAGGSPAGSISIATYGAAAAKSKKESAPCSWRSREMADVFETMPVTLEAAEKLPIRSGRPSYRTSSSASCARSISPSRSSWIVTTSAIDSRHGSSLLWCS